MRNFSKHKWWIITVLLTAPLIALAAGVPNVFAPNTVISSAQVNANFTNLSDRVTALEAANAKTTATQLRINSVGPIPTTGLAATYTATGVNPLLLIVSATAFTATAGSVLDIAVEFDGAVRDHLQALANEATSHKALPTRAVLIPTPAAGAHTITLDYGTATTTSDANDRFSITVMELH